VTRFRYRLHLGAASLLLVLLAGHRFATVTSAPGGRFEDPDALFHAHRAARAVRDGTFLPPVFDRFENFPTGGVAMWPPLHDASLALLARLGGSTAADPAEGITTAAAFPVLELVAALFVAATFARRVSGETGGVLAAWLFATAPCLSRRGAFGEIDHNITEVLGALLLLLLAERLSRENENGRESADERRERRGGSPWRAAILWTAALLLALGFYAGLVMAAGIVAAAVLALSFLERGKRNEAGGAPMRAAILAAGFALAALVLPFFASMRTKPDPADPWRLGPVYVLILSAAAAGTGAFSLFTFLRKRETEPHERRSLSTALAVGAIFLSIVLFLVTPRAAWGGLLRGLGFIGARDPWLFTIDEFRPLFTARPAVLAALPVVPVALVVLALALTPAALRGLEAGRRRALLLCAVPFFLYALLAVAQKRFLPVAAAFGAAAGGGAWGLLRERSSSRWYTFALFLGGLYVSAQSFLIPYIAATLRGEPAPSYVAGEEAAAALAALTPSPGDPPAWGVLAPWDYGHDILVRAGRAVALNNFGNFQPGFERATRLFLAASPAAAVAGLERLKLRYVVVAWAPNVVPGAAVSLGEDPAPFFAGGWSPDRMTPYTPTALGERTLLVRLHLHDGLPFPEDTEADRRALSRLRKVWESPETGPGPAGRTLPFMKLFELVPSP